MARILFEHVLKSHVEPGTRYEVTAADDSDRVKLVHNDGTGGTIIHVHVDDLAGLIPKLRAAERFVKNRRADRAKAAGGEG